MADDYYKTLGVERNASQDDIQKAYRKLARKLHPDMNPDDPKAKDRFKKVQEAFDTLGDPEKRAGYDRYGADFERMRSGGWSPQSGGGAGFEGVDLESLFGGGRGASFSDFFEQLVGGGRGGAGGRGQRGRKGGDVTAELSISLKTAITGGKTDVSLQRGDRVERVSVSVPMGIEDGGKLRLRGQGQPGVHGGAPGDLLLTIRVEPHPWFERDGSNLKLKLPVTLAEAALGAKIDVPAPGGTVTLTVPPGASAGRKLRVRGQGVPSASGTSGDLLVELQIILPKELDTWSQDAIRQIDQRHPVQPRKDLAL